MVEQEKKGLISESRLSQMEAHADEGGTFQAAVVQELIGHIRALSALLSTQPNEAYGVVEEALAIAVGDIAYLANERNELPRFKDTLDLLAEAINTHLPALLPQAVEVDTAERIIVQSLLERAMRHITTANVLLYPTIPDPAEPAQEGEAV